MSDVLIFKTKTDDDAGSTDPESDIFDTDREINAKTEFATFGDFQAIAGHLFSPDRHRAIWDLAKSWLFKAERNPRLEDLQFASGELKRKSTSEVLHDRGYIIL
jgi:hypothetical protein